MLTKSIIFDVALTLTRGTRGRESGANHSITAVMAQELEEGGVSEGGRCIGDSHGR